MAIGTSSGALNVCAPNNIISWVTEETITTEIFYLYSFEHKKYCFDSLLEINGLNPMINELSFTTKLTAWPGFTALSLTALEIVEDTSDGIIKLVPNIHSFFIGQEYEFNNSPFSTELFSIFMNNTKLFYSYLEGTASMGFTKNLRDVGIKGLGPEFNIVLEIIDFLHYLDMGKIQPVPANKVWVPLTGIKNNKIQSRCFKCGEPTVDYDSSFTRTKICPICKI